jgi:hypothetical protein
MRVIAIGRLYLDEWEEEFRIIDIAQISPSQRWSQTL